MRQLSLKDPAVRTQQSDDMNYYALLYYEEKFSFPTPSPLIERLPRQLSKDLSKEKLN